ARPDDVAEELEQVLGFPAEGCLHVAAKSGQGIDELIAALCEKLPGPTGKPNTPTRALIFDSIYDDDRGVIVDGRPVDGELKMGQTLRLMGNNREYPATALAKITPRPPRVPSIGTGEVGYAVAWIKDLHDVRIGDTVTAALNTAAEPLPGYQPL